MLDVLGRLRGLRDRERAFRERQRARVEESRRRPLDLGDDRTGDDEQLTHSLLGDTLPRQDAEPMAAEPEVRGARRAFGQAGRPLNRQSPFYVGFVGAIGVLAAYALWQAVSSLGTVLTLLTVAFFLTLSLNPVVELLVRRGLRRGGAVAAVFALAVGAFVLLGFVVVPPVTQQAGELAQSAPRYVNDVLSNPRVQDIDQHYHVVEKIQEEVNKRLTDSDFMSQVAGGVLGAGRIVAEGIFSTLTVLVLTLYFLSSLPTLKQAAYAVVPASRRPRVISLSEEIMRRVGSYAIGQVVVAAVNAFCAWIMMSIVGIPYAAVLAVAVGFLGLVPMVGATLGGGPRRGGRPLRRPDQGGHRARLLHRLPADRELPRRAADHAADRVGAGRRDHRGGAHRRDPAGDARRPARHPRGGRPAAALRRGAGPATTPGLNAARPPAAPALPPTATPESLGRYQAGHAAEWPASMWRFGSARIGHR